jgi:protease PrsW
LAKFNPAPVRFMLLGLFFATIMHGAYDFFLMQQDYPALTVLSAVALAVSVSLSFVAMRSHQRNSPFRNA